MLEPRIAAARVQRRSRSDTSFGVLGGRWTAHVNGPVEHQPLSAARAARMAGRCLTRSKNAWDGPANPRVSVPPREPSNLAWDGPSRHWAASADYSPGRAALIRVVVAGSSDTKPAAT
jgi:hypothetical protein